MGHHRDECALDLVQLLQRGVGRCQLLGAALLRDVLQEHHSDRRLDRRQSLGVTTAAQDPDGQPRPSEAASPTKGATKPPTKREQALAAARAESAAENGLCT